MLTTDPYIPQSAQPDLSVYLACAPEKLLPLFRGQLLSVPFAVFQDLKEQADLLEPAQVAPCRLWLQFFKQDLRAEEELLMMERTPDLHAVGPFYYLPEKICFHFPRHPACTTFGAEELLRRHQALQNVPAIDALLQKSLSQRSKATKKTGLSPEELQKEIQIGILALTEQERFAYQVEELQNQALLCSQVLSEADSIIPEPGFQFQMPQPDKQKQETEAVKPGLGKRLRNFFIEPVSEEKAFRQHQKRQYLMALKIHENACDRYKEARENWEMLREGFCEQTQAMQKLYQSRLAAAEKNSRSCLEVLKRSPIHPAYQRISVLKAFLRYLETGRATHLQSCINLYEEEQHWSELKDSQYRIENTILSWQLPELEPLDTETVSFLHSVRNVLSRDAN